ncbi:MAG: hypothetical protein JWQ59_1855 [Cryobacterium sp.]|jgi:uncharacterized membrane protein|nr:hypothetical protein [Cryobacterium sp.]
MGYVSWQWRSIVVVWLLALAGAVVVWFVSAPSQVMTWIGLTAAACTIATLAIQIGTGRKEGYVERVTASIVGMVVVLAAATGIFVLAGLG